MRKILRGSGITSLTKFRLKLKGRRLNTAFTACRCRRTRPVNHVAAPFMQNKL
jgi:hypothetical protein